MKVIEKKSYTQWISKKDQLMQLIKQVNAQNKTPDNEQELNLYIGEVIINHRDKLDEAIKCFESLITCSKVGESL